jgi:hypothetical protein
MLGIIGAIIGGVILGGILLITYDAICKFLNKAKKISGATTIELLRRKLKNGEYRVVANVFNSSYRRLESQTWEGKELDGELQSEFGQKNEIIYDLRS